MKERHQPPPMSLSGLAARAVRVSVCLLVLGLIVPTTCVPAKLISETHQGSSTIIPGRGVPLPWLVVTPHRWIDVEDAAFCIVPEFLAISAVLLFGASFVVLLALE